jgi:hypothetical protein
MRPLQPPSDSAGHGLAIQKKTDHQRSRRRFLRVLLIILRVPDGELGES